MEAIKERIQENWSKNANNYDEQYLHGLKSPEEAKAWHALLRELDQHLCAVFVGINQLAVSLIRSNAETKKSILLKIRAEKVSPREAYAKNSHMIYYPYERQLTELLRSFIGIFAPQSANIA